MTCGHDDSTINIILVIIIKMLKTYQFKTHCKGDSHSSKTANIILPGLMIKKLVPWGTDGRLPLSDIDLDLGSGHTAYRRASLIDLYLRTKFQ